MTVELFSSIEIIEMVQSQISVLVHFAEVGANESAPQPKLAFTFGSRLHRDNSVRMSAKLRDVSTNVQIVRRFLAILPRRAQQTGDARVALRRLACCGRFFSRTYRDRQVVVVSAGSGSRICLRLDRTFFYREKSARYVQASAVVIHGGLENAGVDDRGQIEVIDREGTEPLAVASGWQQSRPLV